MDSPFLKESRPSVSYRSRWSVLSLLTFYVSLFFLALTGIFFAVKTLVPVFDAQSDIPFPSQDPEQQLVSDDTLIAFQVGPDSLRVPKGYLSGPMTRAEARVERKPSNFAFRFWVPDKRAPLDQLGWYKSFRPIESGSPPASPGQFIVEVSEMRRLTAQEVLPSHRSPRALLASALEGKQRYDYVIMNDRGVVVRTPHIELRLHKIILSNDKNSNFEFFIECPPTNVDWGRRACDGKFYFPARRIAFFARMPDDAVGRINLIANLAVELFDSWKVDDPN